MRRNNDATDSFANAFRFIFGFTVDEVFAREGYDMPNKKANRVTCILPAEYHPTKWDQYRAKIEYTEFQDK